MKTYLHKTSGRLRIRSDYIHEHADTVAVTLAEMMQEDGVLCVSHKRFAGSVAVQFDPHKLDCDNLLSRFSQLGWLSHNDNGALVKQTLNKGTKSLLKSAGMLVASRLVGQSLVKALAIVS